MNTCENVKKLIITNQIKLNRHFFLAQEKINLFVEIMKHNQTTYFFC
jgi:hypothetical protein